MALLELPHGTASWMHSSTQYGEKNFIPLIQVPMFGLQRLILNTLPSHPKSPLPREIIYTNLTGVRFYFLPLGPLEIICYGAQGSRSQP